MPKLTGSKRTLYYCNCDNIPKWLSGFFSDKDTFINSIHSDSISKDTLNEILNQKDEAKIQELIKKYKTNSLKFKAKYKELHMNFNINFDKNEISCTYANEDEKLFDQQKEQIFNETPINKVKRKRKTSVNKKQNS